MAQSVVENNLIPEGFTTRICPYCGSSFSEDLFMLEAAEICKSNWTYSTDFRIILDLKGKVYFPISRCKSCDFVYAKLLPDKDFLTKLYDVVIIQELGADGSKVPYDYMRRLRYISQLVQLFSANDQIRALDFGCGFGMSAQLLSLVNIDVIAYDPSQLRIDRLTRVGIKAVCDVDNIDKSAPYNIIICDNTLEHVPDIHSTVKYFSDIMSKNGVLYISVPPYEKSFINKLQSEHESVTLNEMTLNPWEHLNYFDKNHLDGLMRDYDFYPIKRCDLPEHIDIGLRPESSGFKRWKNGIASIRRLFEYLYQGTTTETVTSRFYRFSC